MPGRADAANRARGSLVLAIFGSLWLAGAVSLYANMSHAMANSVAAAAFLSCCGALCVLVVAWRTAARLKPWAEPWSPAIARGFWI